MTVRLAVDGFMVRVELHDSGHVVLQPKNPAAAIAYLHLNRKEDVVLTPAEVEALRDMLPSDDGICHGWVDVCTTGITFRVPYRRAQTPYIRELLRVLEQEHGYPARQEIGVREPEPEIPLEIVKQEALL